MITLDDLETLFAGEALANPYGEDIAIREHMLQCAELAVRRGAGAALVAAALLHDIGWVMGDPHEQRAADYLLPLLGPAVAEPIRQHVAAKRYLVATRPDYFAQLSAESRRTLARQGGPFTLPECARFEATPGFADAIALRLIDDAGKELRASETSMADYRPILADLALAARQASIA